MRAYFTGDVIELAAGAEGTLTLDIGVDLTATALAVNSSGRCEISDIERLGQPKILDGFIELDQLKKEGNIFPLPSPEPFVKGDKLSFKIKDISGATNRIYIALFGHR